MTVYRIAMVLLLAAAAPAHAQRGMGGGGRGEPRQGEMRPADNTSLGKLSSKDIQKFDPVKVLLDKKKDLKLEAQQTQDLTKLEEDLQWNLRRITTRIDSTQKSLQPKHALGAATDDAAYGGGRGGRGRSSGDTEEPPEPADVRRQRILDARKIIQDAVVDLQREHDSSTAFAMRILTEPQRPPAAELLKKRNEELQKMLKDAGFGPASVTDRH